MCLGREQSELDIYIFQEVLDHIAHVDRVLTYPGGSLLLAGRSGVGRRTAVRLVAHMHHMEIITPHISRNYTIKNFKNDLKNVRLTCIIIILTTVRGNFQVGKKIYFRYLKKFVHDSSILYCLHLSSRK